MFYKNVGRICEEHAEVQNLDVPFQVISVGNYYNHDPNMCIDTAYYWGRIDYQLLYVHEGFLHFVIDGKKVDCPRGTAILFRPREPQVYYNYGSEGTETYWAIFTGSEVESILKSHGMPDKDGKIMNVGTPSVIRSLFERIILELQLKRKNFDTIACAMLKQLFLEIDRSISEDDIYKSNITDTIMAAARYFKENYSKNIVIDDYAKSIHMSSCWFIKNFRIIMGLTPMQYIVSARIDASKNLLTGSDITVSEIASMIGYDNSLYFSRLFSKHVGMSPTHYRKAYSKEAKTVNEQLNLLNLSKSSNEV